jgi:hypothetical protein
MAGKVLIGCLANLRYTLSMKPNRPVRRFDVFAEYQRLKALEKEKLPDDQAKGYGIWLAKVVAARKFSKTRKKEGEGKEPGQKKEEREELVDNKWHALEGIPQTDALFDHEIIQRMGEDFYQKVFSPSIEKAYESGKDYMDIRDTIREDWKPEKK